jgi:hypothetical protein
MVDCNPLPELDSHRSRDAVKRLARYWEIGCLRSHHIKSKSTATIKRMTSPNCLGSNFFLRLLFLVRRLLPAARDRAGSKCYCLMLLGNASQKALELHHYPRQNGIPDIISVPTAESGRRSRLQQFFAVAPEGRVFHC